MPATKKQKLDRATLEASLECACLSFRQASRMITQLFDEALRPTGLLSSQLPILILLALDSPLTVTRLANLLVMDRTTLTKNLKGLKARGLIREGADQDRRKTLLKLTSRGEKLLVVSHPLWEKAQQRVVSGYGPGHWKVIRRELAQAVEIASRR